jgi:hypothetical protein
MKIKAGKVVPVHVTKPHRGSRGIAPLILNLGNRWGSAVSFMLHLLHPHGKISGYQLNRCGDPGAGLDILEKRKISCTSQDSNPRSSSPLVSTRAYGRMRKSVSSWVI